MKAERDFQNCQRIISDLSSKQIAIMTLALGFQSAGFVGFYVLLSNMKNEPTVWLLLLSGIMIVISVILCIVWHREHDLINKCILKLKDMSVWFPEEDYWTGWTKRMWKAVHYGSIIIWLLIFIFPECIICSFKS